jgi:Transposase DDE domain
MTGRMIPQPESTSLADPVLFPTLHLDTFKPMELCFAILLRVATNAERAHDRPTRLADVFRMLRYALAHDPLIDELIPVAAGAAERQAVRVRVQVAFWAHVLGVPVEQLCQWTTEPRLASLVRAIGLDQGCYPQRIAELHTRLGPEGCHRLYAHCKTILVAQLDLAQLAEADVRRAVDTQTFHPLVLEMGQTYGLSYFLNFVFWHGVFAQLEAALHTPLKPNGYSLRELLAAYLRRFDTQAETPEALAEELRAGAWAPASDQSIAPCSQTLRTFLANLNPDQVILVQEALAQRALTVTLTPHGRKRLIVAIDATLLSVCGSFAAMAPFFDHVSQHYIQGYKLYVLFEVQSRQPLAFVLHEPGAVRADGSPKGDADYLADLLAHVKAALGVEQVAFVLFDKGFWSQAAFKQLVETHETLVTPAKRFKTIQQAMAAIPQTAWVRAARNQRVAETAVSFDNGLTLRLIVWKELGQQVVRNAQGKTKRDSAGKPVYRRVPIHYAYVTNIPATERDAGEVVGLYSQRWGIEDFFEQMDNQYGLGRLPGSKLAVVKVHLALTLLGYTLLTMFQQLVATWLSQIAYATMELRRFARLFLRAPIAWLLWRKHRQPGQHPPQRRSRHRDFLTSLAEFGGPAPGPELL